MHNHQRNDGGRAREHIRRESDKHDQIGAEVTKAEVDLAPNMGSSHGKVEPARQVGTVLDDQHSTIAATPTATMAGAEASATQDADRDKNTQDKKAAADVTTDQTWEGMSLRLPESVPVIRVKNKRRKEKKENKKKKKKKKKSKSRASKKVASIDEEDKIVDGKSDAIMGRTDLEHTIGYNQGIQDKCEITPIGIVNVEPAVEEDPIVVDSELGNVVDINAENSPA